MSVVEIDEVEDPVLTECFIIGDGEDVVDASTFLTKVVRDITMGKFSDDEIVKESDLSTVSKSIEGSRQLDLLTYSLSGVKVVEPPYSPEIMKMFLQSDGTNFRCIATKAQDYVGRPWKLSATKKLEVTPTKHDEEDTNISSLEAVQKELDDVTQFLKNCNPAFGFEGVMVKAAIDLEAIGWAAIEVIRSADMKVQRLDHVPAERMRVVLNWKGFIETADDGKKVYYQPFGAKVLSKTNINSITGLAAQYDPVIDGELGSMTCDFNMIDWETGEPTSNFAKSANEILWVQKFHPATIYYGVSDSVPILSKMMANMNISNYLLQFFEHNTIPRYVVIIKGATLDKDVKDTILNYFRTEVRGRAHKTLVLPLPGRSNIEVTFQKLDTEQDGWFRESAGDNDSAIRVAHGVPGALIGVNDAASLGSGKGLSQAEIYKDRVVVPGQTRWANIVNNVIQKGRGNLLVYFCYTTIDTRDKESDMRIITAYLDRGIYTINEARYLCGQGNPLLGGDRAFLKLGNSIIFIDEMPEMVSGQQGVPAPVSKGGDQRTNKPASNAPENGVQNIVSGKASGQSLDRQY